jgi:glycosyltransferase involved in cell wall biosynthesis
VSNVQGIVRFASSQYLESEETLSQFKIDCKDCIEHGFFYMPNQWWKHKNHLLTIKAFLAYRDKGGKKHLVLTGTEYDYRYPDLAREIRSSISEHSEIHSLGVVSRQHQKELFKTADLLIQPSICEGWSTTIEEGLYFGVPILASNINVNMEQLEGCEDAIFFDPSSFEDLALKLNYKIYKIESNALNLRREMREQRFKNDLQKVIESTYKFISEEKT